MIRDERNAADLSMQFLADESKAVKYDDSLIVRFRDIPLGMSGKTYRLLKILAKKVEWWPEFSKKRRSRKLYKSVKKSMGKEDAEKFLRFGWECYWDSLHDAINLAIHGESLKKNMFRFLISAIDLADAKEVCNE